MKTLFTIELFNSHGNQVKRQTHLTEFTAAKICDRERPYMGSSYMYRTDANDGTAATKADRKQYETPALRFNSSGDIAFPKYRTSKVNIQAKTRCHGDTFFERKAKQIREYYLNILRNTDQVIYVHTYQDSKRINTDIRRVLLELSSQYPGKFITLDLDKNGFIVPSNEPTIYPTIKGVQPGRINEYIAELTADLRPIVDTIEADPVPVTKWNYGRYLDLLTTLCKGDKTKLTIVTSALLDAGANADGLAAAYKIYKG